MSDAAPGPDWWLASDGRWYPPPAPGGATHHGDPGGGARQVAENWQRGADGEAATARELTRLTVGYRVFHDLKVPGAGKANIDHLVLGPSGVWLIDTKAWSGELTPGKGTLWRGRTPIQKEIDQVEWQAEMVAERLGADVNPMLCFVGTALPRPAQMVQRTRVVALDALVDHIVRAPQVLLPQDVDALDHWARTMQVSSPRQAYRRPGGQEPATAAGAVTPPVRARPKQKPRARTTRKRRDAPGLLKVVVAIALAIWAGNHFSHKAAERVGRPSEPSSVASTTSVPGLVRAEIACPTPGLGWRIDAYLTIQPDIADARVSAVVNGIPAFLGQIHRGHRTMPLERLEPNQPVLMTVEALDAAGQVSGSYTLNLTTPTQPC